MHSTQHTDLRRPRQTAGHMATRRPVTVTWTLRKALDEYILARKDLKPASATYYRHEVGRNLGGWLDRPLASISPEDVEDRHREIQAEIASRRQPKAQFVSESGAATANQALRIFGTLWSFVADRDPSLAANPVRRLKRGWYAEGRLSTRP